MSDQDIVQRLKDGFEVCIKSCEDWHKDRKNQAVRQTLEDAVHELRKALARVEIDMAISEGRESGHKPLPIPSHKSSRPKTGSNNGSRSGGGQRKGKNNNAEDNGNSAPQGSDAGDMLETVSKAKRPTKRVAPKDAVKESGGDNNNQDKPKSSSGRKTLTTKTLRTSDDG
jgi:hypothetical protein